MKAINLTPRETEVLELLSCGKKPRQIATDLFISHATARHHVQNIIRKTGSNSVQQVIASHLRDEAHLNHAQQIIEVCKATGITINHLEREAIMQAFSCDHECSVHVKVDHQ